MGWFSKIEQPAGARPVDRDLAPVRRSPISTRRRRREFTSLHDCFIRELKPGARPIDPDPAVLVSPCDAIVGACGPIEGTELIQAKGFPYTLQDLLVDPELVAALPRRSIRHACG